MGSYKADQKIREGWITVFDTPELTTTGGETYEFKKGDTLPSWLYASFPRGLRQKYFKKNDELLGNVYGTNRAL